MPDILLVAINARYAHTSFGLRYLKANLGDLQERTEIIEFEIKQSPSEMLATLLEHSPKVVAMGIYIWNAEQATKLAAMLKQVKPSIPLVLGGPEISFETQKQEIAVYADYIITGEGDLNFANLCHELLAVEYESSPLPCGRGSDQAPPYGQDSRSSSGHRIFQSTPPTFDQLVLPYPLYTDEDIAHRVIYVEASRGCPFLCEFCLSSLDNGVRNAPTDRFLQAMQGLLDRGAKQFKFVDRTFNLNIRVAKQILEFFLERYTPGMFLHFEMIPDRLPDKLRAVIQQFPAGSLQFEVGIQSFNEDVTERILRRQDATRTEQNLRFLRRETGVHLHTDLIVGLPGESMDSFARGFDRLIDLQPHEIQVGLLKRLRGTPIVRHDTECQMIFSPHPPYEILQTSEISFAEMQRLRRFARYWDLVANSGNFINTLPLIFNDGSPFHGFMEFSDWLFVQTRRTHGVALIKLIELIYRYLTEVLLQPKSSAGDQLLVDYRRGGRNDTPPCLRDVIPPKPASKVGDTLMPPRQHRFVQTDRNPLHDKPKPVEQDSSPPSLASRSSSL